MGTEYQIKYAVDGMTVAIIRAIHDAGTALGHRAMLIGATARIILIEHVFGLQTGRATRDVDFAFALDSWEQFAALKQRLIDRHGFVADGRIAHRLYFQPTAVGSGTPVDLVPFGALSGADNELRWPPEMSIVMNVAGFADALGSAANVTVAPGLTVAIASLPAIAVLKLFAWLDRRGGTPKDAIDLTTLLRLYSDVDQERVYAAPPAVLEDAGYDIELAAAWLLGSDARQLTFAATTEKLSAMLAVPAVMAALTRDMARALRALPAPEEHAAALLAQFTQGFRHR